MPKRALGYGELPVEKDSPERRRRLADASGNARRPSNRRSSEILLGLSHSCKKHAEFHKERKSVTLHDEENDS